MNTSAPAIRTHSLVVTRQRTEILHAIDLEVPTGDLVGLLGPSGGGKTTLMRSIVGAQVVSSGSIDVLGLAAGHPKLRHELGYMPQSPAIYDDLTVDQNLRYFASVGGRGKADADDALAAVGLGDARRSLGARLSGGQRNRVSLAIALLGHPRLLVFDEPTVGLDPALRRDLWNLFRQLRDQGSTLVVSSHVMDEARRCDRLLLMYEGRIIADDTPDGLLAATGAKDHDDAFLALVDSERSRASSQPGTSKKGAAA